MRALSILSIVVVVRVPSDQQSATAIDVVGDGLLFLAGVEVVEALTGVGDHEQHGGGQVGGSDAVGILDPVEAVGYQVVLKVSAIT
jgi:hypothetical protein